MHPGAAARALATLAGVVVLGGCSSAASTGRVEPPADAALTDAANAEDAGLGAGDATEAAPAEAAGDVVAGDSGGDRTEGGLAACSVDGNPGHCMTLAECSAMTNHTSTPGYCPGPSSIECCTLTPNVADNPPIPAGWVLMPQSMVTPAMTAWAVSILNDPTDYPMFATATQTFGSLTVLARVEWHPPDFQNSTVHRGVTLYEPG